MARPISATAINALRMRLKRATAAPLLTPAERNAARKAKRDAHRAEVLAWGMQRWDAAAARLRAAHGPLCAVELGIGLRPDRFTLSLADQFQRRQSLD